MAHSLFKTCSISHILPVNSESQMIACSNHSPLCVNPQDIPDLWHTLFFTFKVRFDTESPN